MKIVADEDIPFLTHYFSCGNLIKIPGREIQRHHLLDADILLVRSITKVNEDLLRNTPVKFVGSATTGIDHMDIPWLNKNNIKWYAAVGCNSVAVVEYVICVIAALQEQGLLLGKNKKAGIIGVGNIGSLVTSVLSVLGFHVVQCDPIREREEKNFRSTALKNISDLDFITLHTPLTFDQDYPTHHMIEKNFLQRQKKGCVLLNTGRGSVIESESLKRYGNHLHWCFDVWENEPYIDFEILQSALIATPHIAGYSVQAKYRGIEMVYRFALQLKMIPDEKLMSVPFPKKILTLMNDSRWREVVLSIYNPMETSFYMKKSLQSKESTFDRLRKNFNERYEFSCIELKNTTLRDQEMLFLKKMGMTQ